jgi:hypothetical protein
VGQFWWRVGVFGYRCQGIFDQLQYFFFIADVLIAHDSVLGFTGLIA